MNKDIFNQIYEKSLWNYKSGRGSDPIVAAPWINTVNQLLLKKDINSILDLGCGDWRIGKSLNIENKYYLGVDVSSIIIDEISQYSSNNIKFVCDDIETMDFPEVDLIIIKDVLQHLPNNAIIKIVDKIIKSCKYALLCNDFTENYNTDIVAGEHRPINLNLDPFNYGFEKITTFQCFSDIKMINLYRKAE